MYLRKTYEQQQCLFEGTKDENIWDTAPWLFQTDENVYEAFSHPLIKLGHCIVFESRRKLEELGDYLRHFLYREIDGQEYFFRFWDARVIGNYLAGCTAADREAFFGDVIDAIYLESEEKEWMIELALGPQQKLQRKKINRSDFFKSGSAATGVEKETSQPATGAITSAPPEEEKPKKRRFLMD